MNAQTLDQFINEAVFEAVIKRAIEDNFELRVAEIEADKHVHVFSKRHEHRMKTLFKRVRRRAGLRRIVTVAAILLVMLNGMFMANSAVRGAIKGAIIAWFDKQAKFVSDAEAPVMLWEPVYIPEGFIETYRIQQPDGLSVIVYTNGTSELLQFSYDSIENALTLNDEGILYKEIMEKGIVYHTFTAIADGYKNSIVWDMDEYRFCIVGNFIIEELLKIAQSVL